MSTELVRAHAPGPGPIRPFRLPPVRRALLGNGMTLLVVRHGELPLVTADLVLPAGAAADPPRAAGVARLVLRLLETGTRSRTAEEVAWELEYQGVEMDAEAGWDAATIRMTTPRSRIGPALALLAELVREPAFPEAEVARLRDEQRAELLQRLKDPRALASDRALGFLYAAGEPYARPIAGTRESVARLTRDVVTDFYAARFAGAGAALILVGDIDEDTGARMAQDFFGDWGGEVPPELHFEALPGPERTSVYIVDRPGSVQSELRIGHVGVERSHPDYFAILVMNEILGGAFTSRLNMSLRERHGFTYGASSAFAFRRRPGPFLVQAAVSTEVTARAVDVTLAELRRLRDEGASEAETAAARDFLRGVQPLQFQTTDQIATRLSELVVYRLPDDYFARYTEAIGAITVEDVNRVAREHLHPDRLAVVIAGDAAVVAEPLEALGAGPVEVHPAELPPT